MHKKNFLIIRPDRIGDLILTIPLIESVKLNEDNNRVWVLVNEYTAPVLYNNPNIDNILVVDEFNLWNVRKLRKSIERETEFYCSLTPTSDFTSAVAPLIFGVPMRIGPGNRMVSFLYNKLVTQHRTDSGLHETELNLNYLIHLNYTPVIKKPRLYLKYNEIEDMHSILFDMDYSSGKPLVVVHPGSGGSSREMSAEKYLQIARALSDNSFIVITGLSNNDPVELFKEHESENLKVWQDKDLRTFMALLDYASLYIGGDTGPMHIASAFNTPVIAVFSPIKACSSERWGPLSDIHYVVSPRIPPCDNECDSCEYFDCMDTINVDIILSRARDMLKEDFDEF